MSHFSVQLEELNQTLLEMGGVVESSIRHSVQSLLERNKDLAKQRLLRRPVSACIPASGGACLFTKFEIEIMPPEAGRLRKLKVLSGDCDENDHHLKR